MKKFMLLHGINHNMFGKRNPEQYEKLLKGMICDWREHWRQKTLPFIIVQLPACAMDMQGGGAWSVIRIAQWRAAQLPLFLLLNLTPC